MRGTHVRLIAITKPRTRSSMRRSGFTADCRLKVVIESAETDMITWITDLLLAQAALVSHFG